MKVKKREINDYMIFDLEEDISIETAQELEKTINASINDNYKKVVLNIKRVEYINSFALGILIKTMQEVESKNCEFYLMNAGQNVKALLKVTGVMEKFKFFKEE